MVIIDLLHLINQAVIDHYYYHRTQNFCKYLKKVKKQVYPLHKRKCSEPKIWFQCTESL